MTCSCTSICGVCCCGEYAPPTVQDLARVRRRGVFAVEVETRTVYRSNLLGLQTERNKRRTRMTAARAYLDAAWALWCEGHPCTCGRREADGKRDNACPEHADDREPVKTRGGWEDDYYGGTYSPRGAYRQKVIARLARWLRWRDGRLRAVLVWLRALEAVLRLRAAKRLAKAAGLEVKP